MNSISYQLLSKYRTELMGIAIIWVFFFHTELKLPSNLFVLDGIKNLGYGGVDIFLLLSGLGLYFSLRKNNSLSVFFRNRFERVLPTYWIVITVFSIYLFLVNRISIPAFLLEISTAGFWLNLESFDWYVPSILVLYLLFPIFFKAFSRNHKLLIVGLSVLAGAVLSALAIILKLNYLLIFTTRIPVFFIGAYLGYLIETKQHIPVSQLLAYGIAAVIGFIILYFVQQHYNTSFIWAYGLCWIPFIFIAPGLSLIFARVIDIIASGNNFGLLSFLRFCGRYSLEIYLLHGLVFRFQNLFAKGTSLLKSIDPTRFIEYCLYFVITLLASFGLHLVMDKLLSDFGKRLRPSFGYSFLKSRK